MGKRVLRTRRWIQGLWAVVTNGYLIGFVQGKIYTGTLKNLCLPGLNCYSCPGSLGSCPIGAVQAVLGDSSFKFSYYLLGFFLLIGTLLGRFVCGFLCPFGLIQELLHKIPFPKKIRTFKWDRPLRYLKYIILILFVILLPMVVVDVVGTGSPWFCKWLCPAGTLEAGIPLVLTNPLLQQAIGWLYGWKFFLLAAMVVLSILLYRPFCKYICPLGAIYALFNKFSLYRYGVEAHKCTHCKTCEGICPMNISPVDETNHPECVRCGACKAGCPEGAICSGFKRKQVLPAAHTKDAHGQK